MDMFGPNFDIASVFGQQTGITGTSNFVWPSGFTPEDPPSLLPTIPDNPFEIPSGFEIPGMTDTRLINALQSQTAFIEGDPGGSDLELYYYRLVRSRLVPS